MDGPQAAQRMYLRSLCLIQNLNRLQIHNYGGTRFRGQLGDYSFCNIVSVSFQNCENFCILLPLGKLPSLKHFSIEGFDELVAVGPEFYGNNSLATQRFLSLKILKCSWMSAWEEWCSIRVEDELQFFSCLQELHLDVLLKYQDQHRALLGLLKLSNFLKQSFMQFCSYVFIAYCLVYLTEYIPQTY